MRSPGGVFPGAFLFCAALAAGAEAPAADRLEVLVGRNGGVLVKDGEAAVAEIQPGVFLKDWRHRDFDVRRDCPGGEPCGRAKLEGEGFADLKAEVLKCGRGLCVTYVFTPSADAEVHAVKASVRLAIEDWAGAPVALGEEKSEIPAGYSKTGIVSGRAGRLVLGPRPDGGELEVSLSAESPLDFLVQDNRRWGHDLELRVGEFREGGPWVWKAGETVTVSFKAEFGKGVGKVVHDKELVLKAGKDWVPMRGSLEIEAGSALDFSGQGWTRSPAGELGRLVRSKASPDTFEFEREPGKPVRFYGPNFCFSGVFPAHEQADKIAVRLARLGYNSIRIHHYETVGGEPGGLVDEKASDSLTFNPESLDRLEYFISALKKNGLYVTTDLYVNRRVKAAEVFPGEEGSVAYGFKSLVHVNSRAFDNWKEFARRFLAHVNPYTGLALKDDPVLLSIVLINEGNLANNVEGLRRNPLEAKLWDAAFEKWKANSRAKGDWGSEACKRFLWETHVATQRRMIEFLRRDVGLKAPITDINGWTDELGAQVCRTDYDYVDNHYYWDHPHFLAGSWRLPSRGGNGGGSAIKEAGGLNSRALTRLVDRPYSISEFNYCAPNRFRAEGGLLAGALGALQDWDALWRFSYSHWDGNLFEPSPAGYFDGVTDPLRQASEYAALALFLGRHMRRAEHELVLEGTRREYLDEAHRWVGGPVDRLAWCVRLGTRVGGSGGGKNSAAIPVGEGLGPGGLERAVGILREKGFLNKRNETDPAAGIYLSDTGEAMLDAKKGVFTVTTARTAGVAGPEGTRAQLGPVEVLLGKSWATLWATALDGEPIERSRRILLVHLTDLQNTGIKYRGRDMQVLEEWGKTPYLVRAGEAEVAIRNTNAGKLAVYRLDLSGRRVARVRSKVSGSLVSFKAKTATKPDATLYYEIASE